MKIAEKLLVIGLDCAPPALVFDKYVDHLPNIKSLMDSGLYGDLRSCDPPITVPAWACMTSGKSPGALGIYGFRNRKDHSYGGMSYADSTSVHEDRVWDILSKLDKRVIVINVPQTYPPRWVNGLLVGCMMTPDTNSAYTFPLTLKREVAQVTGGYIIDVKDFRTDDKDALIAQINEMTDKRFALAKHFIAKEQWDFFMMVEMGPDRMHHGLWKYADPLHRKHIPGAPWQNSLLDYYKRIDAHIGEMLTLIDRNKTAVMIVSDHGAKRMDGGVCINEWLIREGYLKLKQTPPVASPIEKCEIDWANTTAWGEGGYYGRLFMNVKGREPQGLVPPGDYEKVRNELAAKITAIPDENGAPMATKALKPEDLYAESKGVPPDLFIYFDDLNRRSIGAIGGGEIHSFENDTGPDDANHDYHGIFILSGPGVQPSGRTDGLNIIDCAPAMLKLLGVPVPPAMTGHSPV